MPYWKGGTGASTPFASEAAVSDADKQIFKLSALEVVVLVVTFLSFVGQFINLAYALVDHSNIKSLTVEVRALTRTLQARA
jgi:hypothetical protein